MMLSSFGIAAMSSTRSWLVNENCEGTGLPAAWTTVSGTPNWDYTTVPLADAQSLYVPSAASAQRSRVDFTDKAEVWIYFLLRLTNGSPPGSGITIGGLGPNGGALSQNFSIDVNVSPKFGTAQPVGVFIADTTYHVWLYYKQGTGANAVISTGFSTTGVRPTSGNNFAQVTNNAGTNLGGRWFLGPTVTTANYDLIWDNIRIANSQIGDFGI